MQYNSQSFILVKDSQFWTPVNVPKIRMPTNNEHLTCVCVDISDRLNTEQKSDGGIGETEEDWVLLLRRREMIMCGRKHHSLRSCLDIPSSGYNTKRRYSQ